MTFVNATGYSNITKNFWGGSYFQGISCGKKYSFAAMSGQFYDYDDAIIVPVNPSFSEPNSDQGGISFGATFWDYDWPDGDDRVAHVVETVIMPLSDWPTFDKEYNLFFIEGASNYGTVRIRVTGFEGFLQP